MASLPQQLLMSRLRPGSEEPHVIGLSLDFGMTASGVAFDDGTKIKGVPWPAEAQGNKDKEAVRKIPTSISYDEHGEIAHWAFNCAEDLPRAKFLFKSLLDPQVLDSSQKLPSGDHSGFESLEKVRECVADYLTLLLEKALRIVFARSMSSNLAVNLSVTRPTTWGDTVVVDYLSLVSNVFGRVTKLCSSAFSLSLNSLREVTESHAAGAYAIFTESKEWKRDGRTVIYVLDVGGATTDPGFLQAVPGYQEVRSLIQPSVAGIRVGCIDLDNRFVDHILQRLRSICEQEKVDCDISSTYAAIARAFRFHKQWIEKRNSYSEAASFHPFHITIPQIPSDDQSQGPGLPERKILITQSDMKAIFDEALITPLRELLAKTQDILTSTELPKDAAYKIAHVILCGGGGLIPYVYECVRNQMGPVVQQTKSLMAPSLGALHLLRQDVDLMHASLMVGTKKSGDGAGAVTWLTPVKRARSPGSTKFSQKWQHLIRPEVVSLSQRFVLLFPAGHGAEPQEETWVVDVTSLNLGGRRRLGMFRIVRYRICLTLPTTTNVVTAINFTAFRVSKTGRETKIECQARKE